MAASGAATPSPTSAIVSAARRWLVIPIALALLGGLGGGLAGTLAKPSAEALLLVRTDATDSASVSAAAENAALELNTRQLFDDVVADKGGDAEELRSRTTIAAKPNSQIVSVTVTAPTSAQAITDASDVADAAVAAGPDRVSDALDQITNATRELISSHRLSTTSAEQARVARLGDALAASQSSIIEQANRISLLQSGEASRSIPSATVLGVMGALAGALLGLGIAAVLGARRGTIKSARELAHLYPHAAVIGPGDLGSMITTESATSTVLMAGVGRSGSDLAKLTDTVSRSLAGATGRKVVVTESMAAASPHQSPNGHINLVLTTLSETVVRRATRDQNSILIVPVEPRVTRLEALDAYAPRLHDRTYLLVDERAPKWK